MNAQTRHHFGISLASFFYFKDESFSGLYSIGGRQRLRRRSGGRPNATPAGIHHFWAANCASSFRSLSTSFNSSNLDRSSARLSNNFAPEQTMKKKEPEEGKTGYDKRHQRRRKKSYFQRRQRRKRHVLLAESVSFF
jgi:hypothetical protein